jgi:hypothetical protein
MRAVISIGKCSGCGYPVLEEINHPDNHDGDVSFRCSNQECDNSELVTAGDQDEAPEWAIEDMWISWD